MVVAQAAGNGSAPGEILLHKRTHHIILKTLLVVDHVIRDAQILDHPAGIVNVVNRAAASLNLLWHARMSGEPSLVPELHSQANHIVALSAQHGRDGGG